MNNIICILDKLKLQTLPHSKKSNTLHNYSSYQSTFSKINNRYKYFIIIY